MFTMRFDMRAPATGAPTADLYGAALEMAAWADGRGALAAILCEHHGMSDGYLPVAPRPGLGHGGPHDDAARSWWRPWSFRSTTRSAWPRRWWSSTS